MGTALDIALADIGAWGLAGIGGLVFLARRALDRSRLVAPPKEQPAVPLADIIAAVRAVDGGDGQDTAAAVPVITSAKRSAS